MTINKRGFATARPLSEGYGCIKGRAGLGMSKALVTEIETLGSSTGLQEGRVGSCTSLRGWGREGAILPHYEKCYGAVEMCRNGAMNFHELGKG